MFLFGFCAVRPLFRLLIAAASARSSLPSFLRRYGFLTALPWLWPVSVPEGAMLSRVESRVLSCPLPNAVPRPRTRRRPAPARRGRTYN